ncbi:MAG: DUF423 domain-containing protein [Sandaracinaceae bacterium]|nr:DUF423 domain-containing protein [Sandaracinaceae bacterium]
MERSFLVIGGVLGALAVGLGAYGAHGLEAALEGVPDAARRLGWWRTAVSYHLPHAGMVVVVALLAARRGGRSLAVAGGAFVLGVALFSGTLYAMSLGAPRWLGAITPLGGLSLIVGWLALVAYGLRER